MLDRKRILIIDDSSTDRTIYRRYLERTGIPTKNIVEAATGHEGIVCALQELFDCVILDFRLPDLNGLEVLEKLRPATKAPILFISGDPAPHMIEEAYAKGATRCLIKDRFSYDEWLEATIQLLTPSN
jgi:CheY-like chemotaxis protein